jgi:hypothetical protein
MVSIIDHITLYIALFVCIAILPFFFQNLPNFASLFGFNLLLIYIWEIFPKELYMPKKVTLESLGVTECPNPPKYSVPIEITPEYAKSRSLQERFESFNKLRFHEGKSPYSYEEYLQWRKT